MSHLLDTARIAVNQLNRMESIPEESIDNVNDLMFVYSPFKRQGSEEEYNLTSPVADLMSVNTLDIHRASEVIAGLDADGVGQHLCVSINMNTIFPVRMPPDAPPGTKNFFSHRATVIMQDKILEEPPSVRMYQAVIQLIPRPRTIWVGARPLRTYEAGIERERWRGDDITDEDFEEPPSNEGSEWVMAEGETSVTDNDDAVGEVRSNDRPHQRHLTDLLIKGLSSAICDSNVVDITEVTIPEMINHEALEAPCDVETPSLGLDTSFDLPPIETLPTLQITYDRSSSTTAHSSDSNLIDPRPKRKLDEDVESDEEPRQIRRRQRELRQEDFELIQQFLGLSINDNLVSNVVLGCSKCNPNRLLRESGLDLNRVCSCDNLQDHIHCPTFTFDLVSVNPKESPTISPYVGYVGFPAGFILPQRSLARFTGQLRGDYLDLDYLERFVEVALEDMESLQIPWRIALRDRLQRPLKPANYHNEFEWRMYSRDYTSFLPAPPGPLRLIRIAPVHERISTKGPLTYLMEDGDNDFFTYDDPIVTNPENLLPQSKKIRLIVETGVDKDIRRADYHIWMRLVNIYLLRLIEEVCCGYGLDRWLEDNAWFKNSLTMKPLLRYCDPTLCELHLRLDTNVYLYPMERESARQMLSFVQTFHKSRRPEDMNMALRALLVMIGYTPESEKRAAEANGRRIKGEFGRPGEYPADCEKFMHDTDYIPSTPSSCRSAVTLDSDEELETPDSY